MAKKRLRNFRNIEFRIEDVLDFERKSYFDVVVHCVLHDIPNKDREKFIDVLKNSLKRKGIIYIREPTRKSHGIDSEEIKMLMKKKGFLEKTSIEGYTFPIRGKVYEGFFWKSS